MYRTHFPDHLTAGVLVIDSPGEQVLLNLHRKAQRWFAFGGHCEPGDATLAGAALREGLEESGLDALRFDPVPAQLDEHPVPFCDRRGIVHHLDVRYVAAAPERGSARHQRRVAGGPLVAASRPARARARDAPADRDRAPTVRLSVSRVRPAAAGSAARIGRRPRLQGWMSVVLASVHLPIGHEPHDCGSVMSRAGPAPAWWARRGTK